MSTASGGQGQRRWEVRGWEPLLPLPRWDTLKSECGAELSSLWAPGGLLTSAHGCRGYRQGHSLSGHMSLSSHRDPG